jgi:hypothetical protein
MVEVSGEAASAKVNIIVANIGIDKISLRV